MGEWETKLDGYCRFCGTWIRWNGTDGWVDADGLMMCRSKEHRMGIGHHGPAVDAVQHPQAPEDQTPATDLLDYVRTMARTSGHQKMAESWTAVADALRSIAGEGP